MCTALTFSREHFYFGRNLDLEYSYHEEVTIVPRNFPLSFRNLPALNTHHAIIGMAHTEENYPLFYEAVNEHGLCAAALNFPASAHYPEESDKSRDIGSFELIPLLLGTCASLQEAKEVLGRIRVAKISFGPRFPVTPLHWLVADKTGSLTVEPTAEGLMIYDNDVGVLTNEPPFPAMLSHLCAYSALSPDPITNRFSSRLKFPFLSNGMGAMGLPGDLSSPSRFVKAAFTKENAVCSDEEGSCVGQFFHILGSVEQQRGCVRLNGKYEITVYASCCNADTGDFYFVTYNNRRIRCVHLHGNEEGTELLHFPLCDEEEIRYLND